MTDREIDRRQGAHDVSGIDDRLALRPSPMEWLAGLRDDIAYTLRALHRAPGLTVGVVLTLALGFGANLAMFSLLDVVFLRPPAGVERPEEVRRIWTDRRFATGPEFWSGYSYSQYTAIASTLSDRVATALYLSPRPTRFGRTGEEIEVRVSRASASYFPLLGARPAFGRFYTADEDRLGSGASVAVASQRFWRRQLGGDASALGRELVIAGRPYVLIGVTAAGFTGTEIDATDLWVPLAAEAGGGPIPWWRNHRVNGFQILLRAAAGLGDDALEARIAAGLRTPEALVRPGDTSNVVRVGPIIRAQGPGTEPAELTIATRLAGVTILVLIVACANVINLLLARAVRRRRELALRLAMGMTRARLMRLLLSESAILAMIAATVSLLSAYWGGALIRGWFLPDVAWASSPLHWRVVALAGAAGIGAGLIAGLLPAIQAAKTDLADALKTGASDDHAGRSGLRATVVGVQSALSVVLLVGAGLFVRSLDRVHDLRIGFDQPQRIVLGGAVQFDTRDSLRDARLPQVLTEVAERLRRARGVEQVALARMAPKQEFGQLTLYPDVDTTRTPTTPAIYNAVSPEFFAATGMRVLRGEDFPRVAAGAMPTVVVVNEAMARAQWPGMEAVGRCLRFDSVGPCYRVIGVVETAIFDKLLEKPQPQFYLPLNNAPAEIGHQFSWLIVRAEPHARQIASATLQRALRDAFPGGRPSVTTMEQLLEPEYRPWRLGATLFTSFGLLALTVAAVGIYSAVSYTVAQRTREFGVRLALGARLHDILRSVIGGSLRPVAIGVTVGIALAVAGGRFIAALLYEIKPTDPGVIVGVAFGLLLIAAAAAFGPAWRAARVDPVSTLRSE